MKRVLACIVFATLAGCSSVPRLPDDWRAQLSKEVVARLQAELDQAIALPTAEPADSETDLLAEERANGFTHKTRATCVVTIAALDAGHITWSKATYDWPQDQKGVAGWMECYVLRDGSWQGGKFEWAYATGGKRQGIENLWPHATPAYGCWQTIPGPRPGEQVCFLQVKRDGSERTVAQFKVMP